MGSARSSGAGEPHPHLRNKISISLFFLIIVKRKPQEETPKSGVFSGRTNKIGGGGGWDNPPEPKII